MGFLESEQQQSKDTRASSPNGGSDNESNITGKKRFMLLKIACLRGWPNNNIPAFRKSPRLTKNRLFLTLNANERGNNGRLTHWASCLPIISFIVLF